MISMHDKHMHDTKTDMVTVEHDVQRNRLTGRAE